ncbi:MAG: porin [Bacteroidales bacterium]|nr:porin [Bacteroidales bacterium]
MKRVFLLFVCCFALIATSSAQQPKKGVEKERALIFITGENVPTELRVTVDLFKESESPYFQDPRAPRFIMVDRKNRVAFGIGGYVKATTSYDFSGIIDDVDFITYDIPIPKGDLNRSQLLMDASTSRLFFKLVGQNRILKKFSAYIETDFRGNNYALRLRQAYLSFRGMTIGQTWSTFTDLAAIPPTIDFEGPSASIATRNVQFRYTLPFRNKWEFAIAIENPNYTATLNDFVQIAKQRCPDIPIYIQYEWNKGSHVRVSGILRGMRYNDLLNIKGRTAFGWGVQLSGVANMGRKFVCYYQGMYGKGISKYVNDLGGNNLDLGITDNGGCLKPIPTAGAVVGLQYNILQNLFASVNYSYLRLFDNDDILYSPSMYKQGQYLAANMFMTVANDWQFGVEYLWGARKNQDDLKSRANRVQVMAQYNF